MDKDNLIFSIQTNRDLFKPALLIGKKVRIKDYKHILKSKEVIKILNDDTINETIDAFTKGGLNLTEASANSYVHRNTLIYRINKVQRAIGLDFKKFEDCMIYLSLRELYKMVIKNDV